MTLTDFLLARIADTERAWDVSEFRTRLDPLGDGGMSMADRVLAECEAKRQIVELSWHHLGDDDYGWGMEEAKRQILALLALPYADHPDYEEWKP